MALTPTSTETSEDLASGSGQELPCARLVQVTDPHLLKDANSSHRSVNTSKTLERVLHHAQSFIKDANAVLLTGDIAQDEEAQTYARLRHSWTTEWVGPHTPVWCLPGNHDAPVLMQSELCGDTFSCLGHHILGNWEIILLDSRNPGKASGLLGKEELERLRTRLSVTNAAHVLIFLHHHPLPLGRSWLDKVGLEDRGDFERIIFADTRIKGVAFGHIHQVFDRRIQHVRFLGCPSTGVQFTPNQTEFGLDAKPPGFRTLTLYPSGRLRTEVFWITDEPQVCAE